MKKLETEIRKHGHTLRQLWRNENTAIYQYHGGFEVILIKKRKAGEVFGKPVQAREAYPCDAEWGRLGITRPASDSLEYLKKRAEHAFKTGSFATYLVSRGASKEATNESGQKQKAARHVQAARREVKASTTPTKENYGRRQR